MGEEVECRTVSVDGITYEVIPAELIVRAGLLAASHMMSAPSAGPVKTEPCDADSPCGPEDEPDEGSVT